MTVTTVAASKVVLPSRVAVTRAVLSPPSSSTESCTSAALVSASTVSVSDVGGASLSVMVPVACAAVGESVALVGDESSTRKVSLDSERTSSSVFTVTLALVAPAAMVAVVAATAV